MSSCQWWLTSHCISSYYMVSVQMMQFQCIPKENNTFEVHWCQWTEKDATPLNAAGLRLRIHFQTSKIQIFLKKIGFSEISQQVSSWSWLFIFYSSVFISSLNTAMFSWWLLIFQLLAHEAKIYITCRGSKGKPRIKILMIFYSLVKSIQNGPVVDFIKILSWIFHFMLKCVCIWVLWFPLL